MKCVCCNNENLSVYKKNSFLKVPVYYCSKCRVYASMDVTEKELKKKTESLYKKSYWDERESENTLKSNFTDVDSQGKRRQWISQYAYCEPNFDKKKTLLEIGSGPGQALIWFEEKGFEVTGIEPDERNVSLINKKLEKGFCRYGFAESFQVDDKFDIVWMSHVFEHTIRPDLVLEKIAQIMNEDAILFIEVPNCDNNEILSASINIHPSTFHFTKYGLIELTKLCGYDVIRCDYFRGAKLREGAINKIAKKYLKINKTKLYPFYPKIATKSNEEATDLRIILKMKNNA